MTSDRAHPEEARPSKTVAPRRTVTGRVVYNRPIHHFTIKDWARVGRSVPPPNTFQEALVTLDTLFSLARDITSYVLGILPQFRIAKLIFDSVRPIIDQALEEMLSDATDEPKRAEQITKVLDLLAAL